MVGGHTRTRADRHPEGTTRPFFHLSHWKSFILFPVNVSQWCCHGVFCWKNPSLKDLEKNRSNPLFPTKNKKNLPGRFHSWAPTFKQVWFPSKIGRFAFFPLHYVVERREKMPSSARANSLRVFCIRSMLFQSGSAGWYVDARYASHKWRFRLGHPKSPGGDWHPGWGVDTNSAFFDKEICGLKRWMKLFRVSNFKTCGKNKSFPINLLQPPKNTLNSNFEYGLSQSQPRQCFATLRKHTQKWLPCSGWAPTSYKWSYNPSKWPKVNG